METTYIDKLAFIEILNRRVLETRSYGKDARYIPGGKRENNESDQEALMPEMKEELQIDIIPETLKHYGTFEAQAHGKPKGTLVRMTCYQGKYSGKLAPSAEVEQMDWFDSSRRNEVSPVDQLISDDLKSKDLID